MSIDAIWVFDSKCVLCNGGVQYTLRHEKRPSIRFVSIQSEEGRALALSNGLDPDDPTTFLFVEAGQALEKSDAVLALAKHLNGIARCAPLLRILPKALRDLFYTGVAKSRYRVFGQTEICILPTRENANRFSI